MFKWPKTPTRAAKIHELADFVELVTWQDRRTSAEELKKHLGRPDEVDSVNRVLEEDDLDSVVEAVFEELECRLEACAGSYPFDIARSGQMVRFVKDVGCNMGHILYAYMLLATRLNMNVDRMHAGMDGTKLFEELASEVARSYLGERSESLVFGTGAGAASFEAKVRDLCRRTGEGDGFFDHVSAGHRKRDGRLDVVAWTPFSDNRPGKLLIFGQCKTGTHYQDELVQLRPDVFCGNWFRSQPAVTPVRAFFIAEALSRSLWRERVMDAGLLFDRCRIVDFVDGASPKVIAKVVAWTTEAANSAKLSAISTVGQRE